MDENYRYAKVDTEEMDAYLELALSSADEEIAKAIEVASLQ